MVVIWAEERGWGLARAPFQRFPYDLYQKTVPYPLARELLLGG